MRRGGSVKNPIAFLCVVISACCLFVSILRLPNAPAGVGSSVSYNAVKHRKLPRSDIMDLGVFGEMMIGMLPQDLMFTVFVPSQEAFERDLRLSTRDGFSDKNTNNTYATISRVLGFSAVPRNLSSASLPTSREANFDSLSGFLLHVSKDEGFILVNGIQSEQVDIKKGEIVLHVMDGVLMDADFKQSAKTMIHER